MTNQTIALQRLEYFLKSLKLKHFLLKFEMRFIYDSTLDNKKTKIAQ